MTTRRQLSMAMLGAIAVAMPRRNARGQPDGQKQAGDGLGDRGAPTGRIGAATRSAPGADGHLAIELVAPARGIGLTASDQPTLYYLLSDATTGPMRLAISTRGQARPLADLELRHTSQPAGLHGVDLRAHGVRLAPSVLYVWSIALTRDPRSPARDLVASALIEYQPVAANAVPPDRQPARLARAGYWYDAVALAAERRGRDGGAALADLLAQADLRVAGRSFAGGPAPPPR